jgi:hypothetical protein
VFRAHKQQLEEMAEAWTMLAKERVRQLEMRANIDPAFAASDGDLKYQPAALSELR